MASRVGLAGAKISPVQARAAAERLSNYKAKHKAEMPVQIGPLLMVRSLITNRVHLLQGDIVRWSQVISKADAAAVGDRLTKYKVHSSS